jgi:hypothetical protein
VSKVTFYLDINPKDGEDVLVFKNVTLFDPIYGSDTKFFKVVSGDTPISRETWISADRVISVDVEPDEEPKQGE